MEATIKLRLVLSVLALVLLIAGIKHYVWPRLFPSIEVVHAVHGPAVQAVYATGTVEATVMMPLAARGSARLMALNVDEGAEVKKGDVLAQLEDDDLQHTLGQLQAAEQYAKKEYTRNATMVKNGMTSQSAYEQAKSNWEAAVAATAKAKSEAGYMKLVAPADGKVIKRDGEIGELIPANQPVLWMSCCAPLRISTEVDEEDVAQVKPGQNVLIRADAFPGKVFHGTVQGITPKGDPVDRSYRVRIAFSEETPLQIGMTAETNIIINESKDALLVPVSAVSGDKVWLVKDGKLTPQTVVIGAKGPQQIEIREGITDDDNVVMKPTATLIAGKSIRPIVVKPPIKPES